jgi:hypothetical protein
LQLAKADGPIKGIFHAKKSSQLLINNTDYPGNDLHNLKNPKIVWKNMDGCWVECGGVGWGLKGHAVLVNWTTIVCD